MLVARGTADPSGPWLEDALRLLARLQDAASRAGWVNEEIKVRILQARALEAMGDGRAALGALWHALTLAEPGGYVRMFVDEGEPMRTLLKRAPAWVGREGDVAGPGRNRGLQEYAGRLLAACTPAPVAVAGPKPERSGATDLVEPLSGREMEVLRLLATSLSSPEMASELVVSANTVRTHIRSIYGKLGVHNRMEAVERARRLKLI